MMWYVQLQVTSVGPYTFTNMASGSAARQTASCLGGMTSPLTMSMRLVVGSR